ncbi:CPBP family intramembrane metalloprotease [Pleurocapsales cyanobacterium LEGE 10410]|nr:CPBP family intramembrane metalloprotease [Pleurocapsales cyanobacterium LEGE 10410]
MSSFTAPVRLLIFIGVLSILWLPLAIPIYWLLRYDSNLASILTMALLFVELLFFWRFWGKSVHNEAHIFARYGLVRSSRNSQEFLKGLAIGLWFCLGLFIVEALLGWIEVTTPSASLLKIVVEGWLSAVGIGLAEELLFRGWLLDELQRDYDKKTCIYLSATIFALAHFLKPITEIIRTAVTFPALVLLGIALVLAKYRHGDRLGICIGIHGGLVWGYYIVNVGELIEYSDRVPVWVTGIDGNPIAGVMGLIFLAGLTLIVSTDEHSDAARS